MLKKRNSIVKTFRVTENEYNIEKSARWIILPKMNYQCDWWHMKNGQNQFLGRFHEHWEWFQGGVRGG